MNMNGYLFIANGRVVSREEDESLQNVKTSSFEAPFIYAANQLGYKLYMGINRRFAERLKSDNYDITFYNQHIYRNIFAIRDIWIGYKNLCKFLNSHPDIEVLHCNTPIGGVLGRLCGKRYNISKIIYTAHGFHFYKGAPFLNRILYRFIESMLAHFTDAIIAINHEDYIAASKFHYRKGGHAYYLPGVGVNASSFNNIILDKKVKREELKIPQEAIIGIVVGDLNENKNCKVIIDAASLVSSEFHLIICGEGPKLSDLEKQVQRLKIADRVHFLGYRKDIKELYLASDIFLFASKREGLPRSTMEAMCSGLPCVVSKIRGNIDLIEESLGGFLIDYNDSVGFAKAISSLMSDSKYRESLGNYNKERIKSYDIKVIEGEMVSILKTILCQ